MDELATLLAKRDDLFVEIGIAEKQLRSQSFEGPVQVQMDKTTELFLDLYEIQDKIMVLRKQFTKKTFLQKIFQK